MNYGVVRYILGWILVTVAVFLLFPFVVGLIYGEDVYVYYLVTSLICLACGFLMAFRKPKKGGLYLKEGYFVVALGWIMMSMFGALPFVMSGEIPHYIDAVFETFVDVLLVCNLGADLQACLLFHALEPPQALGAYAFEASRVGAGFPDACAEHIDAEGAQSAGGFQHLFFSLGAARAGDNHRFGESEEAPVFYGNYVQLSCHFLI